MRILPSTQHRAIVARVARAYAVEAARVEPVLEVVARDVEPRGTAGTHSFAHAPDEGLHLLEAGASAAQRDAWLRLCAARGYGAGAGDAPRRLGGLLDITVD